MGANNYPQYLKKSPCWIVWDKENGPNHFADCELAYTSFDTAVRKFIFKWAGILQGDMKNKEIRIHPTQKPVKLYEWILINYAKVGNKILDTHGGSMSIVEASANLGFDIDIFEIDNEYFKDGVKRIEWHIRQLNMYVKKPILNVYR